MAGPPSRTALLAVAGSVARRATPAGAVVRRLSRNEVSLFHHFSLADRKYNLAGSSFIGILNLITSANNSPQDSVNKSRLRAVKGAKKLLILLIGQESTLVYTERVGGSSPSPPTSKINKIPLNASTLLP